MNKILIALFGMIGLSVLTPAMAHADSLSISFSSGYPVYAAPVTTYHYVDYRPVPNVIVVNDYDRHPSHDRGHHVGHYRDHRYDQNQWRHGHAEHERYEHRQDNHRATGYGFSGHDYQPSPVIKRIDTNARLYR